MNVPEKIRSRISHIIPHLCRMPKRVREKRLVVALRAFFDESAISPQDGTHLIMAGYVGTVSEFERAADSWQDCLDAPQPVPYFHSREHVGTDRVIPLAKAIVNHDLQGFIVTIPHAPFSNRDRKITKGLIGSRVYDWGFIYAVKGVLDWVDQFFPEGETVDFIFDDRRELSA